MSTITQESLPDVSPEAVEHLAKLDDTLLELDARLTRIAERLSPFLEASPNSPVPKSGLAKAIYSIGSGAFCANMTAQAIEERLNI